MALFTTQTDIRDLLRVHAMGSVRLLEGETKRVILIPIPSSNPNDPLNWSKKYRYFLAGVVCMAIIFCNFLAAGPTVSMVQLTEQYLHATPKSANFHSALTKMSYVFTTSTLIQGVSNLVWMPLIIKYGRRPVYLMSFVLYCACAIWVSNAASYASHLIGRIFMGFAAGSGECIAPLSFADLFFLHERGTIMGWYTGTLLSGVSLGIVVSGLIMIYYPWPVIYYVAAGAVGFMTVIIFLTLPETCWNRNAVPDLAMVDYRQRETIQSDTSKGTEISASMESPYSRYGLSYQRLSETPRYSYIRSLRVFNGTFTRESIIKIAIRPIVLLLQPPVLWASLVMAVTIGFLIAVSVDFAASFDRVYSFQPWQSGLCFVAGLIGSLAGILSGGWLSDAVANSLTRKNGGIREPEHRLPALCLGLVTTPVALLTYGIGVGHHLHWIVPTIGLGLLNFSIAVSTNISLVYTIDGYRPVAGEVIVSQHAFKAVFGFLLSFFTNNWVVSHGHVVAFGEMAAISVAVLAIWIPLYIWGKKLRIAAMDWRITRQVVKWHVDREVGE